MASAAVNGIRLEYQEHGAGEPLLLIMGLGGQLTDWPAEFVEQLASQGFRVICFDNRDAGLSTEFDWEPASLRTLAASMLTRRPPAAGYQLRDLAADADALLDALGIDAAHVVGISMGGMIAQSMAIDHRERVRSLTSIMSHTGDRRHGRPTMKVIAAMLRRPDPDPETAVDHSVEMFRLISGADFDEAEVRRMAAISVERSYRPRGTARQLTAITASPDRTAGLRSIRTPTLVVHGLADPLVRPAGGIATAQAVRDSRLVMYPDMGHDLPRRRWPELVSAIRRNAERAG